MVVYKNRLYKEKVLRRVFFFLGLLYIRVFSVSGYCVRLWSCKLIVSHIRLCGNPVDCNLSAFLITHSWRLFLLILFKSMVLFNHFIFCFFLSLQPLVFLSIMIFSSKSVLCIRWPNYWNFRVSISYSTNIQDGFS